jgi:formylglycine-generating enzyme required for sulfatase activity
MRLPTEAEWVYAASDGGVHFSWSEIENRATFKNYAWYNRNTKHKSQETGQKAPNSLGLFDMDGNVWEWVGEWQDSSYADKVKYNTNNLAQGRYLFNLSLMDLPSYCDSNRRARSCGNTEKFRRALVIGFRCAK